jgi:hypothetical protein
MPTFEESNRFYLGEITVGTGAPANPPAAGSGILENLMEYTIPLGSSDQNAETRRARANVIEIVFAFSGGATAADVVVWHSRKNPAPYNYGSADSDADTWVSKGAQQAAATPSLVVGNAFQARINGAKLIALQRLAGGGTVTAKVYALADRLGGW